jgi:elongation factor G
MLWLDGRPVSAAVLKAAMRRATIANRFVPVAGGSAYKWKGVQPLLDAIVDYLPSPVDLPRIEGRDATNKDEALAALVFKVVHDGQSGRLAYVRVYTGSLMKGDTLLNPRTGKHERVGRLLRIIADRREELPAAQAGDIAAVAGLRGFTTGDTLCSPESPIGLEPPVFPEPVVSMAIEPKSSQDRDQLTHALARLTDEDPTFRTFTNAETGQTIIAGMGELHLEIVRERLARDHRVEVNTGAPEIAYRETIGAEAEADYLLRKQNGGPGQYARVILRVRPNAPGGGLTIENRVAGGRIPAEFIASVRKGIDEALKDGVLGGHPTVDTHVDIVDGASHSNDSNEQAFRAAAFFATREALRRAHPILLEPWMNVEVSTPMEYQGDLFGDIGRRRGKVLGTELKPNGTLVRAEVPLSELFGYANAIRSLSRGRAAYSMTPAKFDPVPEGLAAKLLGEKLAA